MSIEGFGMDTSALTGPLEARLGAMREAGFSQVMLSARDVAEHPGGVAGAARDVRTSGLRPTGLQLLRDFEGLSGHLHAYKVDIAKALLDMCAAVHGKVLLVCSSTSAHAVDDRPALVADLAKLAMLAVPFGIKIAYKALSWGRVIDEFTAAWELVMEADCPNLGLGIDAFHLLASGSSRADLETIDPWKIFAVQLSDFMWQETRTLEERIATGQHFRVFPGEGAHSDTLAELVEQLDTLGYRGDYSFEVISDDYRQLPSNIVAGRARKSALWLAEDVLRRMTPLPDRVPQRPHATRAP